MLLFLHLQQNFPTTQPVARGELGGSLVAPETSGKAVDVGAVLRCAMLARLVGTFIGRAFGATLCAHSAFHQAALLWRPLVLRRLQRREAAQQLAIWLLVGSGTPPDVSPSVLDESDSSFG